MRQRAERWQRRQEVFEAEIERLQKEADYVRRNISGQRTQQAKGRLRRLSRRLEAIEQGGVEAVIGKQWSEISDEFEVSGRPMGVDEAQRRLRALHGPVRPPARLNLRLHTALRSGDRVIETEHLEVGYRDDGKVLFRSPDLLLLRGECAALIGPNGAGKTTFLRTLLGEIPPLGGKVKLGASLKVGYFAQAHEGLHPELTVLEEIMQTAENMTQREAREFLARFLFAGDDIINKPIGVLSGGERGRVARARLALQGANLLLLDEPTNHLDIGSQEILEAVLAEFPGTILLVTHDRYLIDRLATQIWEVLPDEATLRLFAGSYSEYVAEKEREKAGEAGGQPAPGEGYGRATAGGNGRHKQAPAAAARKRTARSAELETAIAALEMRLAELTRDLQAAGSDVSRVHTLGEAYVNVEGELADRLAEWERLQLHMA
ncbi:MAG: ABC-F family ATP-binding cassette domain-containing protein [Chloroflexi bacterium]|nr:ABC-F family ATP-binding cassette domain-containing protein [Chloroflexota bacterium]